MIRMNTDQPLSYRMLDSFGRIVKQGKSQGTIKVNELPAAVYYLHILDDTGHIKKMTKIVKN